MRFNSPPNWPPPPPGWTPPPDWQPDPSWGPPPPGWQLWVPGQQKNRTPLIVGGIVGVVAVAAIVLGVLYFTVWSKESDEEQIRSVVAGLYSAYNRGDVDAYKQYVCEDDLNAGGEYGFGAENSASGRAEVTVKSVEVNGDRAIAAFAVKFENVDEIASKTKVLVREDGKWKLCESAAGE